MATKTWIGNAAAVAQVSTATIDSFNVDTTYVVTIGGIRVTTNGDTDVATTATALITALNASTHPYFAAITWDDGGVSPTDGTVRGTADTAGVPFVAALTVEQNGSPGPTGTVTDFSTTTASSGPNDWSTAANWSDNAIPASADTVVLDRGSDIIAYGLDQNAVALTKLEVRKTFTGKLGLARAAFATSADGATTDATAPEYRQRYLKADIVTIDVGVHYGPGTPTGSGRIKIENSRSGASTLTVFDTAASATDSGLQAVQYLASHANADVYVRSAIAGVGIATDNPTETSTVGVVSISDVSTTSRVVVGAGTTLTTFEQHGGQNVVEAAATITTVTVDGGTLQLEGDYTVTTLNVNDGTVTDNHTKSGGNAVTTCTMEGGTLNLQASTRARTIATLNLNAGTLKGSDAITITTLNEKSGEYQIVAS